MSETTITRADVEQYVRDTLPYDEMSDWDIDGIVDAMIERWPAVCGGHHPEILDAPIGALGGPAGWYIEHHIDGEEYWQIVKEHQRP